MDYIHRSLERKFLKMSSAFKAVMVTGARQVGKSTMLNALAQDSGRVCVSMDDADIRDLAQRDPKLFFQMYQPPILIDEVQKAPALLEQIKLLCDESDERGRFWLTGSQSKRLMKQAGDSLAGRIGIPYANDFIPNTRDTIHPLLWKRKRMFGDRIIGKVGV